jgi:hypothetical protein
MKNLPAARCPLPAARPTRCPPDSLPDSLPETPLVILALEAGIPKITHFGKSFFFKNEFFYRACTSSSTGEELKPSQANVSFNCIQSGEDQSLD